MDFFKDLWIKIITYLCCISNQETPNTEKPITPTPETQAIEKITIPQKYPDFTTMLKSKITNSKLNPTEKKELLDTHEKLDKFSILLKRYFEIHTLENKPISDEDDFFYKESKRMFHGSLSSKLQGELFLAIEQTNFMGIQKALNNGADVNKSVNFVNPLQYAIRHGKDSVIQFLIEKGAEITTDHIQLARAYQIIYETNLNEKDMQFTTGDTEQQIENEIREYFFIEKMLTQELLLQKQKKEQEKNTPQVKTEAMTSNATAAASSLSARPRVVTFASIIPEEKKSSSGTK